MDIHPYRGLQVWLRGVAAGLAASLLVGLPNPTHAQDDAFAGHDSVGFANTLFTSQSGPIDGQDEVLVQDVDETLGEAPVDTSLLFLRSVTPLLKPDQWDLDYGFRYTWEENEDVILLPAAPFVTMRRYRNRTFAVPLALRYGLTERIQLAGNLPVGFAVAQLSDRISDEFSTVGGLGDVSAEAAYLLREHRHGCTDFIGSIGFSAPTGKHPFETTLTPKMGSGFWSVNAGLQFVQSYDPAVIFGGIGYRHEFSRDFLGGEFRPGEAINYQFGMGFAINDSLTVSTVFLGQIETTWTFDGDGIPGSSSEPFLLRFALTSSASRRRIIEPFVTFGFNETNAPAASFGLVITRRSERS